MLPEIQLWRAVLIQAVNDFFGDGDPFVTPSQTAAERWFFSDDHELGSFLFVCEILDLNPGTIRRWLLRQVRLNTSESPLGDFSPVLASGLGRVG